MEPFSIQINNFFLLSSATFVLTPFFFQLLNVMIENSEFFDVG